RERDVPGPVTALIHTQTLPVAEIHSWCGSETYRGDRGRSGTRQWGGQSGRIRDEQGVPPVGGSAAGHMVVGHAGTDAGGGGVGAGRAAAGRGVRRRRAERDVGGA